MSIIYINPYRFAAAGPTDPDFANVSLLLHGDGTNGSTTIIDSSPSPKTVTAVGDAQISTAQSKFGGSSIAFDGSGDYLTMTSQAAMSFGTDDFTIETWARLTTSTGNYQFIVDARNSTQTVPWLLTVDPNNKIYFFYGATLISNASITYGQWQHYAVTRSAGVIRVFIDGIADTVTATYTSAINAGVQSRIGSAWDAAGFYLNGYIDDLRITRGVARYVSNFTPPTAPFWDFSQSPLPGFDADASVYIQKVEYIDGQELESGVRQAINAFVVGCKFDGIWSAIKTLCILAGARTLAGALVPLVGTAPTNYNFVAGDYDRKTGLKGNGSTKYLDSNRSNSAEPQDSRHLSFYASSLSTVSSVYMSTTSVNVSGDSYMYQDGVNSINTVKLSSSGTASPLTGAVYAVGFSGASRPINTGIFVRRSGVNVGIGQPSVTPLNENIRVFGITSFFSDARLAFYSIGESLDLALLDARVTALVSAIDAAIP